MKETTMTANTRVTARQPAMGGRQTIRNKGWRWLAIAVTVVSVVTCCHTASAATYYVDFAGGANTADGLSPKTAWKHCPGDSNATDKPKTVALAPADTILFKGGVQYFGSIELKAAGAEGKPITLDGNSAGTFGKGRAILDGGALITGWKHCESAEEVQGNPRWKDMMYADLDVDLSSNFTPGRFVPHRIVGAAEQAPWQRVMLIDGEQKLLPIAELPKPVDPFFPNTPNGFYKSPHRLTVQEKISSQIKDEEHLTQKDPGYYDGMFVGVHGGNNKVYFAVVDRYDPAMQQLQVPYFKDTTYPETRYAFFNSPKLIELPGEWCIKPLAGGRTRIYLLPEVLSGGQPVNIGYPVLKNGISLASTAAHISIKNFLIQRLANGHGGVDTSKGAHHIAIADCEVRFVTGEAGIFLSQCDSVVVENCYIHHCPGWTVGIYVNRVSNYRLIRNRLDTNSGSGIRHYESKNGLLQGNSILNHFGMHASGINIYEGCTNIVVEQNYIEGLFAINRNAENIVIRNNIINGKGKLGCGIGMWADGKTGGSKIKDLQFLHNTIANLDNNCGWTTGILGQRGQGFSHPEGLVIKNNILDGLSDDLPGVIENNIYLREVEKRFMGKGCQVVTDLKKLCVDPDHGDYRLREGSPAIGGGCDAGVTADFSGKPRAQGRVDVGAWSFGNTK